MTLVEAVKSVFKNYANFNGRARRSEYWKFWLFNIPAIAATYCLGVIIAAIAESPEVLAIPFIAEGIYSLVIIIPRLSVTCRRLHDVGKSGAYIFFFLLPVIGYILLMVWTFQDGQPYTNIYGEDPKGRNMTPFGYGGVADTGYVSAADKTLPTPRKTPASERPAERDIPPESGRKCPYCGAMIESTARFCTTCGKKLEETAPPDPPVKPRNKKCGNCGKTFDADMVFCPFCGEKEEKKKVIISGGSSRRDTDDSRPSSAGVSGFTTPAYDDGQPDPPELSSPDDFD